MVKTRVHDLAAEFGVAPEQLAQHAQGHEHLRAEPPVGSGERPGLRRPGALGTGKAAQRGRAGREEGPPQGSQGGARAGRRRGKALEAAADRGRSGPGRGPGSGREGRGDGGAGVGAPGHPRARGGRPDPDSRGAGPGPVQGSAARAAGDRGIETVQEEPVNGGAPDARPSGHRPRAPPAHRSSRRGCSGPPLRRRGDPSRSSAAAPPPVHPVRSPSRQEVHRGPAVARLSVRAATATPRRFGPSGPTPRRVAAGSGERKASARR